MSTTELPEWVNRKTVETAYRIAKTAQESRRESIAAIGMRAARARDPRLLRALEGGATILQRMSEEQFGSRGMDVGGLYIEATELQLWKNAYTTVDSGQPSLAYQWIYGAAAVLCGYCG